MGNPDVFGCFSDTQGVGRTFRILDCDVTIVEAGARTCAGVFGGSCRAD